LPFWSRFLFYTQADVVRPAPIAGLSNEYDGVSYNLAPDDGLFANPSPEDTASVKILSQDELETFRGPIPPMGLVVEEKIARRGPRGGASAYLFFDSLSDAQATSQALAGHGGIGRVIVNRVRDDLKASDRPLIPPFKGVVEAGAPGVDELSAILSSGKDVWRKARLALVTQENVLWNKLPEND
jgi:hypothetical protein